MSKYNILKTYEKVLMYIEDIIGSGKTNNIQLYKICKQIFGDLFLNVYSSDEFPKYVKENQCFIINTDPKNKPGTHWIAVYKYKNKFWCYDSFNRPVKTLSKYFKNKNIISTNIDRDQSYNEYSCGARSVGWTVLAHKYGPDKIMNII